MTREAGVIFLKLLSIEMMWNPWQIRRSVLDLVDKKNESVIPVVVLWDLYSLAHFYGCDRFFTPILRAIYSLVVGETDKECVDDAAPHSGRPIVFNPRLLASAAFNASFIMYFHPERYIHQPFIAPLLGKVNLEYLQAFRFGMDFLTSKDDFYWVTDAMRDSFFRALKDDETRGPMQMKALEDIQQNEVEEISPIHKKPNRQRSSDTQSI